MGMGLTKLLVKVALGLVALTFLVLLLDGEGEGNWALGIALVWLLVGVATLILMTRRRYVRRMRSRRRMAHAHRLEARRTQFRPSRHSLGGLPPAKFLADHRD